MEMKYLHVGISNGAEIPLLLINQSPFRNFLACFVTTVTV